MSRHSPAAGVVMGGIIGSSYMRFRTGFKVIKDVVLPCGI